MKIAIWFRICPLFQRCYGKFDKTLLHWATASFFQKGFCGFSKNCSPDFKRLFLFTLNTVLQSIPHRTCNSVLQSTNLPFHKNLHPLLNHSRVPGLVYFSGRTTKVGVLPPPQSLVVQNHFVYTFFSSLENVLKWIENAKRE